MYKVMYDMEGYVRLLKCVCVKHLKKKTEIKRMHFFVLAVSVVN